MSGSPDLKEGDEEFEKTVFERAKEGNMGAIVPASAYETNGIVVVTNGVDKSDKASKGNSDGKANGEGYFKNY